MNVKTAKINGRQHKIFLREPVDGTCATYALERAIEIFTPLDTQNGLVTLIHEILHASNWAKSEETVDRTSKDIGRLFWRLGFRCPQIEGD